MRRELSPAVHKYSVSALITGLSFLRLAEPLLLPAVAGRTSPWLERVREEGSALPALLTWPALLEGPLAGRYAPGEGSFLAGDFICGNQAWISICGNQAQNAGRGGGRWRVGCSAGPLPPATLLHPGDRIGPGRVTPHGPLLFQAISSNHTSPPQLLHCKCVFKAA